MPLLTVFTPLYNRAHLVSRVYTGLCKQSVYNFEWLIINDGSTDNSSDVIKKIISEHTGLFPIRYIERENRGLMRTINQALDLAKGEFFCRIDSDDYPTDELSALIENYSDLIRHDDSLCSIAFLSLHPDGTVVGTHPFSEIKRCDFTSYRAIYGGRGDRNEVMKTDVFKKYKFPEFDGEKFCPEGLVWNRIAKKYDALYIPKGIYVKDFVDDSITSDVYNCLKRNCNGSTLYYYEILTDKSLPYKYRWINALKYYRYSKFAKKKALDGIPFGLYLTAYIPSLLIRLYDSIKY